MQELIWLMEPIHVLLSGGGLEAALATPGFKSIALLAAFLVPGTVIALGVGFTEWRETPLGFYLGSGRKPGEDDWTLRAADLDKDGTPDI